jgi:hypothetical protein
MRKRPASTLAATDEEVATLRRKLEESQQSNVELNRKLENEVNRNNELTNQVEVLKAASSKQGNGSITCRLICVRFVSGEHFEISVPTSVEPWSTGRALRGQSLTGTRKRVGGRRLVQNGIGIALPHNQE